MTKTGNGHLQADDRSVALVRAAVDARIQALKSEITELQHALTVLPGSTPVSGRPRNGDKRRMSAQARKNISDARKRYFAKKRKEEAKGGRRG